MEVWVVKIGTSLIRGSEKNSTENVIKNLCESISNFISEGNKSFKK